MATNKISQSARSGGKFVAGSDRTRKAAKKGGSRSNRSKI